jgi:hypothetical protein
MSALCEAADELKKRSGGKATGRMLAEPVYAFTLNWHEARTAYAARVEKLKAAQSGAFQARTAQAEKLWNSYKADRKVVNDRYQPFIDAIWKSRRKQPPHLYTEQALRDIQESAEWKQLGRAQFAPRRLFNARERALLGAIGTPCAFTMSP